MLWLGTAPFNAVGEMVMVGLGGVIARRDGRGSRAHSPYCTIEVAQVGDRGADDI